MPQPPPSPRERESPKAKAKAKEKAKEKAVARRVRKDDLARPFLKGHLANSMLLVIVPRGVTVHTSILLANRR